MWRGAEWQVRAPAFSSLSCLALSAFLRSLATSGRSNSARKGSCQERSGGDEEKVVPEQLVHSAYLGNAKECPGLGALVCQIRNSRLGLGLTNVRTHTCMRTHTDTRAHTQRGNRLPWSPVMPWISALLCSYIQIFKLYLLRPPSDLHPAHVSDPFGWMNSELCSCLIYWGLILACFSCSGTMEITVLG